MLVMLVGAFACMTGCAGSPTARHYDDPLPTSDDHSLPPDRLESGDAGEPTTPATPGDSIDPPTADAGADTQTAPAPDGGDEPPPPPPDAGGSTGGSQTCVWVRLYGPCPPPPVDGNECVPALYGNAHWELVCHPTCPNGTVWNGSGCVPGF
jgi:hypothetical protein